METGKVAGHNVPVLNSWKVYSLAAYILQILVLTGPLESGVEEMREAE